jgi:maintenance of mitochondrial morphology protein 1
MVINPPSNDSPSFSLSFRPSSLTLSLTQSSLLGSRAKLSDVPKVHQMIESRIRSSLLARMKGYTIVLPGISLKGGDLDDQYAASGGMERREVDVFVKK